MIYNFLLVIYLFFSIPKVLYESLFLKKKKDDLLRRLGFKNYSFHFKDKKPIIWIHAVSLGETKASKVLIERLKKQYPTSYIVFSNTTQTGHNEALNYTQIDKLVYFPIDLPFIIRKLFTQIKPSLVIFVETDFWLNFIKEAKKNNSKVIVVSAKISERSTKRFSKFLFFSKKLFSYIDLILTQDAIYKHRFLSFVEEKKLKVCGNLKLVNTIQNHPIDLLQSYKERLKLQNSFVITLASTHDPEELLLINELKDLPNTKILLAPRHPERFLSVYHQIKKITSASLFSDSINQDSKVIIIDKMGILDILYQISDLAIVGGSFISRVGGHNILEPVLAKTPVFFGPFMHNQMQLKALILNANCGEEVELANLKKQILRYTQDSNYKQNFVNNCLQISKISKNIIQNTLDNIKKLI